VRISDWSSDVCSSDLLGARLLLALRHGRYGLVIAVLPHLDDMRGHLEQRNWLPISLAWPRAKQDRVEGGERVRLHQIFQMLHLGKRLAQVHAVSSRQLVILRSEEHMSALQSLMRTPFSVFCLKKKKQNS